jgi:hypothetical protein
MNTFVLALSRASTWSPLDWMASHGGLELANGQAVIDKNSDWLSITHDDNLIHDFDEEERELLRPLLVGPRMLLIEYKGTRLADLLIQSIPVDCDAMIDNDHGLLYEPTCFKPSR